MISTLVPSSWAINIFENHLSKYLNEKNDLLSKTPCCPYFHGFFFFFFVVYKDRLGDPTSPERVCVFALLRDFLQCILEL